MQYCYPLGGETEAAPTYTETSLPVNYETNAYAAYGQYDTNGTNYYQDPSIYYEQVPLDHYNTAQNGSSENAYTESQSYGSPGDSSSYYNNNYQTFNGAGAYWPTATDNQEATPAATSTRAAPSYPSTPPHTATLTSKRDPEKPTVDLSESAFCSSPTLASPIPRNLYFSPNHFFRMVEKLQDESQVWDDKQSENRPSSGEDDAIFDLKAERNKKVGELLNDNEIKNKFNKVSNDCTSLFKILDRLSNSNNDEVLSRASQQRNSNERLASQRSKRSKVAAKDGKINCYAPVDETKYPSYYENPVYYDVPPPHQVECEKKLENEATKKISKQFRKLEVKRGQSLQSSQSYEHVQSRKQEIEKKKRNTPTATRLPKPKEKLEAQTVHNLLEIKKRDSGHQIHQNTNSVKTNLTSSQADKILKAKEKETPRKERDSLEKMYRDNPVPSNTQLRADVRAVQTKIKLKTKEMVADATYKRIRLKTGSAKKSVLANNLPKLQARKVPPTHLTKNVADGGSLPAISEDARKQLPDVTPRQKAQSTGTRLKDSTHIKKSKDSSQSNLPQVKKPLSDGSLGFPAKQEVPPATLHPVEKEKPARRKHVSSAPIVRTLRKPLPPIDKKLQKRRPFK